MPVPVAAAAAAATAEDLKVEFAEEDERHVVRPVSTKGNVDIQDALSKLRMSVATISARPSAAAAARLNATPVPGTEVDRRLQDVLGAVADETRQDVRKKLTVEIPAELLKTGTGVRVHVVLERNGAEFALPEQPITLKYAGSKKLERVNVRLDVEIKTKS